MRPLASTDFDLRDLARNEPSLIDSASQRPVGVKLLQCIGSGGMATVFLAERDPTVPSEHLSKAISDETPRRLAIKFVKPSIVLKVQMERTREPVYELFFDRETEALRRV